MSRDTIEVTLREIQKSYPNAVIEYCSYLDGISHDGVIIEQFISNEIYSKYIQKNQVMYKNNLGESYIATYNDIMEAEKDGLMIDAISRKIYVN